MVDVVGQKEDVSSSPGLYKLCCLALYRTRLFCRQLGNRDGGRPFNSQLRFNHFSHGITAYYNCDLDSCTTFLMILLIATFLTLLLQLAHCFISCSQMFPNITLLIVNVARQNQSEELKLLNVTDSLRVIYKYGNIQMCSY